MRIGHIDMIFIANFINAGNVGVDRLAMQRLKSLGQAPVLGIGGE